MSSTVAAFQRCPRCGNENSADSFACNFCGVRLKIERIETIRFFKRYEAEWSAPSPWFKKIFFLFVNAPRAFHDINHKRSKAPGWLIVLFSSLLYGLMGLAFISHFNFVNYSNITVFLFNLSFFASFFIFGFCYQSIFFLILIWLFSKGANIAVGFTDKLERRFEGIGEAKSKYQATDISPFSIYKGGTMLQIEGAYKNRMLLCAFTPFLLINAIKALIILVGFPNQNAPSPFDEVIFDAMFDANTWAVLDIIDALTIATWIPILMTLAIRELSNSSTTRVLIPTIIIGILVAIVYYFFRPTIFG